jgi:rhodanese-related sulfurtransferase
MGGLACALDYICEYAQLRNYEITNEQGRVRMFWRRNAKVVELTPEEVQRKLAGGEIVLVDVREPDEYAAERIAGAISFPLSCFDPLALPGGDPARVVFHCAAGRRSATAAARCERAGVAANTHMRGGLAAWKAMGLPTMR